MPLPDKVLLNSFCWLEAPTESLRMEGHRRGDIAGRKIDTQRATGGRFTRCRIGTRDVGSLYPLKQVQLERGVPSHWTPYIRVDDADALAQRVAPLGGRVLVAPFDVERTARIAMIEDAVGAVLGLWQPVVPNQLGTIGP